MPSGGKRKKIYTPFGVLPAQADADPEAQRFRKSFSNYSEKNALLKLLTKKLDACCLRHATKRAATTVDDPKEVVVRVVSGVSRPPFLDHLNLRTTCRHWTDSTASPIGSPVPRGVRARGQAVGRGKLLYCFCRLAVDYEHTTHSHEAWLLVAV